MLSDEVEDAHSTHDDSDKQDDTEADMTLSQGTGELSCVDIHQSI